MRKVICLTIASVLTTLVLAQEPVPAFEWHTDSTVNLPEGSMQIHDDACFGLFMELGLPHSEPTVCYLVLSDEGVVEALTASFASAGYELVHSHGAEDDRIDMLFSHPGRSVAEAVSLLYSDGSVFIAGHQTTP